MWGLASGFHVTGIIGLWPFFSFLTAGKPDVVAAITATQSTTDMRPLHNPF